MVKDRFPSHSFSNFKEELLGLKHECMSYLHETRLIEPACTASEPLFRISYAVYSYCSLQQTGLGIVQAQSLRLILCMLLTTVVRGTGLSILVSS